MSQKQPSLLERMRQGEKLTAAQQLELVVTLSIPAIMAQITSIVMQYIDASMVGSLGADASASIGLVSSSTWLFGGITGAVASGFSIQAAHKIGAGREDEARSIMRQSLLTGILISCALLVLGVMISGPLPGVLGGEMQIRHGATVYFRIFVLFLPVLQMNRLAGSLLQCSGDMLHEICRIIHLIDTGTVIRQATAPDSMTATSWNRNWELRMISRVYCCV